MTMWTSAVLGVLYTCVLYFCICTYTAQLSMFRMERRSRNKIIIIIIIISAVLQHNTYRQGQGPVWDEFPTYSIFP